MEETINKIKEAQKKYIKYYKIYKKQKFDGSDSKKTYGSNLRKYLTTSQAQFIEETKYGGYQYTKHIKREKNVLEILLRVENLNILRELSKYATKLKASPKGIQYMSQAEEENENVSFYQKFFKPLRKALMNKKYTETAKLASQLNLSVQEKVPLNILSILPDDVLVKGTHHLEGGKRWYNEISNIYDRNESKLRSFLGNEPKPKVKFSKSFFPNKKVYHAKTNKKRAEE
jgi:hypothetical protein